MNDYAASIMERCHWNSGCILVIRSAHPSVNQISLIKTPVVPG